MNICLITAFQALAVAGLAVVGRDYYGVYPLRGKPLNARDAPIKQILANKELQDLVAALGLDFTKTYETVCFTLWSISHFELFVVLLMTACTDVGRREIGVAIRTSDYHGRSRP